MKSSVRTREIPVRASKSILSKRGAVGCRRGSTKKRILVEVMLTESILCRQTASQTNERGQKVEEKRTSRPVTLYHDAEF